MSVKTVSLCCYVALARQIYESIKIVESKENDDFPMNSKNEFNKALIVTVKYTRGNN